MVVNIDKWVGTITLREKAFMPETLLHVEDAQDEVQVLLSTRDQGHLYTGAQRTHITLNAATARLLAAHLVTLADEIEEVKP